jgi:dolichol-phosphate mannosyltransferase
MAPEVSLILPTINERPCLETLGPLIEVALEGYSAEAIVIDDGSTDGTPEWVEARRATSPIWQVIRRTGPKGLASAVIEGFRVSRGKVIVVMDADGSHPPDLIPKLVEPITNGTAEFVLASRGGVVNSGSAFSPTRRMISGIATLLSRPLTSVSDPMSGYFALDRTVLSRSPLSPLGFKIGLEVIVCCTPSPIQEVEYQFRDRIAGKSKLDSRQIVEYVRHIVRLYRRQAAHRAR